MATNKISFDSLVSQLVKVFKSSDMLEDYKNEHVQFEFCGWTGASMSPISRPSFVQEFGEDTLKRAEVEARKQIEGEKVAFRKSDYFAASVAADSLTTSGNLPTVGAYVWAVTDWCKGDGGFPGSFRWFMDSVENENGDNTQKVLCQVQRVEPVEDSFFTDQEAAGQLVQKIGAEVFPGGDQIFEVMGDKKYIVNVCLCFSDSGKYCFIDSEGYDYARYVLMPSDFRNIFSEEVKAIRDQKEAEEKAEQEKEAKETAARRADYLARCKKWAKLMQPVKKYDEAVKAMQYGTEEYKKANRKLGSVRRANILAMFKKACPGVKVSLRKNDGWGKSWYLSYQDGPTLEELSEITDFSLFQATFDSHDPYGDYWTVERKEFTDFADKYIGTMGRNGIEIERKMSDEVKAGITDKVCEVVPGVSARPTTAGGYDVEEYQFSREELDALSEKFSISLDQLCGNVRGGWYNIDWNNGAKMYVSRLVDNIFSSTSFEFMGKDESVGLSPLSTSEEENASPVDGLRLVEIFEGVAVVGDSRTTYKHRKEIKAKGCIWNRDTKQWEATTPEAIATVRNWFDVSGVIEEAEELPQEAQEVEKVEPAVAATVPSVKIADMPCYSVLKKIEDLPTRSMSEFFAAHPERTGKAFGLKSLALVPPELAKEQVNMINDFFGVDVVQIHKSGSLSTKDAPYRDGSGWIGTFYVRGQFAEMYRNDVKGARYGEYSKKLTVSTEKEFWALIQAIERSDKKFVIITPSEKNA